MSVNSNFPLKNSRTGFSTQTYHVRSIPKTENLMKIKNGKMDYSIKNNNLEISEKVTLSKLNPSYLRKSVSHIQEDSNKSSNPQNLLPIKNKKNENKIMIPKLDLNSLGANKLKINKFDYVLSQRSTSNFFKENLGFFSSRNKGEYLTTKNYQETSKLNENDDLQRDVSYILEQKKKKKPLKNDILLITKEKREENNNIVNKTPNYYNSDHDFFKECLTDLENDQDPLDFFSINESPSEKIDQNSYKTPKRFAFLEDFLNDKKSHNYENEFLDKIVKDFKKAHPNLWSTAPNGRKEVELIKKWLSDTLKVLSAKNEISKKDKLIICDEAFNLCINELIRQISFDCLERGELFSTIWKNYFKLFQSIWVFQNKEKMNFQGEKETEFMKNTEIFRQKMLLKEEEICKLQNIIANFKQETNDLKEEINNMKKIDKINLLEGEKLKKISEKLIWKIKQLKYENGEMRLKVTKFSEENQKNKMTKQNSNQLYYSQKSFTKKDDHNESNSESDHEKENLKEIMKLLGEETDIDGNSNKDHEIDNPIIIKCFQEEKEKIVMSKGTEMDEKIMKAFLHNAEIQTELSLVEDKYNIVLTNESLEETITERLLKKNMLNFQVENKRASIQKFLINKVDEMPKRNSVVLDLLNFIVPKRNSIDKSIKKSSGFQKNNVFNVESHNSGMSNNSSENKIEAVVKIDLEGSKEKIMKKIEKEPEIVEIKLPLPNNVGTLLEKRNSIIHELSKKIVENKNNEDRNIIPKKIKSFIIESPKNNANFKSEEKNQEQNPKILLHTNEDEEEKVSILGLSPKMNLVGSSKSISNFSNFSNSRVYKPKKITKIQPKNSKPKENSFTKNVPTISRSTRNLRDEIKEKNASEFLNNYLGSTIDKLIENSNEKQVLSISLPKKVISNIQNDDSHISIDNKLIEENENEEEEELKNKILDIIQLFQFETQKNDELLKNQGILKSVFTSLIELVKKMLEFLKEKDFLEKHEEFFKIFKEILNKIPKGFEFSIDSEIKESSKKKLRKAKNLTKFFLVPKLGMSSGKTNIIEKENNPGLVITKKIQIMGKFKNQTKFLHQKQVLKLISQIYDEKIITSRENPQNKELEMPIFSFNLFLNRYGIKKVAERKFTEFLLSVKEYSQLFRVSTFAKMINILDSKINYSVDEMKKYLEGVEYLTEICTNGNNMPHDPSDIKRYVPYIRGIDFIRIFSENKLTPEDISELRKELDSIKENDPKNINKNGIIDLDIYLSKILMKYRHIMNKTKTYVINAFNACDLDGNRMCNLQEFVLLYRHIESQKFMEDEIVKLFEDQADLVTNGEKNMSFDKFTAICVDYQLFSDAQQIKYLGLEGSENLDRDIQKKFEEMNTNWSIRKMKIESKLTMLKSNLEKDDYENWFNILTALEGRVLNKTENMEIKPILIAYKIMSDELERLIKRKEEMEVFEEVEIEEET